MVYNFTTELTQNVDLRQLARLTEENVVVSTVNYE